ncbi:hypothetical protein [Rhizobacter sp. Root1221]|uniref:hypothetical protein n=1 Tax=Rhizobacter sp. Root1221 TaxID=1736433 RepID=UPI0006F86932|nr:hypothetical protein [Rhizobacter sp. Root1221]KQW02903.1 hypothetical protein ASC87_00700 [Rhizobacter sp. Root1221]
MKHFALRTAAAISLAVLSSTASAGVIDITWNAQQEFSRKLEVAPAKFVEVCGKMAAPTTVAWQFETSAALNFSVHYHEGKDVRFPAKQDGTAKLQGELKIERDQDYCWMWTNKGKTPASLSFAFKQQS